MKYDFKNNEIKGFYEWNKSKFLLNKQDKRYKDYKCFKKENGFSLDECWNLYMTICIFILPRLKEFRKHTVCYPINLKNINEWYIILDKIIWSFEEILKDEIEDKTNNKESINNNIQDGLNLFSKYFMDLWW